MTSTPLGTYDVHPERSEPVRMQTSRIGFTSFDISAPVVGGRLEVGPTSSSLRVELALDKLRTSNPLMQAAARALVASGDGQTLVFDAAGPGAGEPLAFSGDAQAGDVVVPMTMQASISDGDGVLHLDLTGSAEFHDVHIPLPGLGGVRTISCDLAASLAVTEA